MKTDDVQTEINRMTNNRKQLNDILTEIAKQAQVEHCISHERLRDFADLIVAECCEVAHCNFHVDGLTLGGILKEHFGVR